MIVKESEAAAQLVMRRTYPVGRYKVFHAWTDPKQIGQWMSSSEGVTTEFTTRLNLTSFLLFFLGVLSVLAVCSSSARAEETPQETVRSVRREIETIRGEIEQAEPYPGGRRWLGRLRGLSKRLTQTSDGDARRSRWFDRAFEDFGDRKREGALRILDDVQQRLTLLEDSLTPRREKAKEGTGRSAEEVKALLRGSAGPQNERKEARPRVEEERRDEVRREAVHRQEGAKAPGVEGGEGSPSTGSAPGGGGFSSLGWLLLAGAALAVLAVGVFLYLRSPPSPQVPKTEITRGTEKPLENEVRQVLEQTPATLWRQADALAADGRFREALRLVYLAVLSVLHRQQWIRFEPTRTNGEYVRQVRLCEQAPPELHAPFQQLTEWFETAWYGERPCDAADYRAGRELGATMQTARTHP